MKCVIFLRTSQNYFLIGVFEKSVNQQMKDAQISKKKRIYENFTVTKVVVKIQDIVYEKHKLNVTQGSQSNVLGKIIYFIGKNLFEQAFKLADLYENNMQRKTVYNQLKDRFTAEHKNSSYYEELIVFLTQEKEAFNP